jgi:hypothetical protein
VSAVDRIPQRRLRKLTEKQRRAYDLLVFGKAAPAERRRAKVELDLRPTREENIALVCELLAARASASAIADALAVTDRSARRLISEAKEGQTVENGPVPLNHAPLADINDSPKGTTCPDAREGWTMYAGQPGYPFGRLLRRALREAV